MIKVIVKRRIYQTYVNDAYVRWKRARHLGVALDFEPLKRTAPEPIADNLAIYDGGYFYSKDEE